MVDICFFLWYYIKAPELSGDIAGWSSPVARRAHNPKVVSSNLAPATMKKTLYLSRLANTRFFLFYFYSNTC